MTLACLALICVATGPAEGPDPASDVAQAYHEARARAGRTPADQVRLALWCEAHGLTAERLKHLSLAVLADPTNAAARGLMGLVSHDGRWQRPEAISEKARADADLAAKLAEYNSRRARTPETAEAQWKLALWCERSGLSSETTAHLGTVVRLDPSREAAWKHLGCKRYEGRWLNDRAIAREKAEAEAQKAAEKKWRPILDKAREGVRSRDLAKREEAEKALDALTDLRAVALVWSTFVGNGTASWGQPIAVRVLGQIDAPVASKALAMLAVMAEGSETRRAATEILKQRDPREFAALLVNLLRDEIKYEVRPVNGPGSPGVLLVQGKRVDVRRLYAPPSIPEQLLEMARWGQTDEWGQLVIAYGMGNPQSQWRMRQQSLSQSMTFDQFAHFHPTDPAEALTVHQAQQNAARDIHRLETTLTGDLFQAEHTPNLAQHRYREVLWRTDTWVTPTRTDVTIPVGRMIAEYEKSARVAQRQLADDVAAVDRRNADIKQSNDRVTQVLRAVSGVDFKADRGRWKAWYLDLDGYALKPEPDGPRPIVDEVVPLDYQPQAIAGTSRTSANGPTTHTVQWEIGPYSTVHRDCFGEGTPIRTLTGPRAIESLRVGDRVLTQGTATGTLGYRPVVGVYRNPPGPTFVVKLGGDAIVSSPFHRFWKGGQGWAMARDLKPGDRLRKLEGVAEVSAVEEGKIQRTYNLDIAEDADFFAGTSATLVHDHTLPDPRLVPFDAGTAPAPTPAKPGR